MVADAILCPDCVDMYTTVCDCCGERLFLSDDQGDENITLCEHCYERHYTHCERCGRVISYSDAYYEDDDEDQPLCYDCLQARLQQATIHDYSYTPRLVFHGERSNERFFGVELEIDGNGKSRKDAEVIEQRKREEILTLLRKCKTGRVVIYSNTVKRVEKLYKFLKKSGFSVACYHGKRKNKMEILQDFQNGKQRIMVCTNAFGLGVNIPDIRLVIHHAPLIGLDDYTQEVGRAGRDGKKSKAVLLWHSYDFTICERLIRKNALDLTGKELKQRLAALHALQAYAQTEDRCRWQMIREFFGEQPGKRCKKRCDYCKRK